MHAGSPQGKLRQRNCHFPPSQRKPDVPHAANSRSKRAMLMETKSCNFPRPEPNMRSPELASYRIQLRGQIPDLFRQPGRSWACKGLRVEVKPIQDGSAEVRQFLLNRIRQIFEIQLRRSGNLPVRWRTKDFAACDRNRRTGCEPNRSRCRRRVKWTDAAC
jgi:hypothetical protein